MRSTFAFRLPTSPFTAGTTFRLTTARVMIIDQSVDHKGILTNAAFVLGLTAGREVPLDTFGGDVFDGENQQHKYLTKIGHFIRKAGQSKLRTLRQTFSENPNVILVDYTEDASPADYSQYSSSLADKKGEAIQYRAMYVYGPEAVVVPLTKNLSRLE